MKRGITLQQRARELHRDRRAFADRALDLERAATDLGAFAHHGHAEVTLGARRLGVEPDSIVPQLEHDGIAVLANPDPEVRRLGVLERVHDRLARDVEDQQRDRRRQGHLLDIEVVVDVGIPPHFVGERLQRLGQALRAQGRPVQVADQRPDAI
jgi:hypothetical protein